MRIITNHHYRDIEYGFELTEKEKKEFDYYNEEELTSASFFRYRGEVYDMGEFMIVPNTEEFKGWDGYRGDSFFSGIVVKYSECNEGVKVGLYLS